MFELGAGRRRAATDRVGRRPDCRDPRRRSGRRRRWTPPADPVLERSSDRAADVTATLWRSSTRRGSIARLRRTLVRAAAAVADRIVAMSDGRATAGRCGGRNGRPIWWWRCSARSSRCRVRPARPGRSGRPTRAHRRSGEDRRAAGRRRPRRRSTAIIDVPTVDVAVARRRLGGDWRPVAAQSSRCPIGLDRRGLRHLHLGFDRASARCRGEPPRTSLRATTPGRSTTTASARPVPRDVEHRVRQLDRRARVAAGNRGHGGAPARRGGAATSTVSVTSICRLGVTHVLMVPSLYRALLERRADRLDGARRRDRRRRGLPAVARREHHRGCCPTVDLVNEYGPTEASVWATVHRLSADDDRVPDRPHRFLGRRSGRSTTTSPQPRGCCRRAADFVAGRGRRVPRRRRSPTKFVELDGRRWYRTGDVVRLRERCCRVRRTSGRPAQHRRRPIGARRGRSGAETSRRDPRCCGRRRRRTADAGCAPRRRR